jgi:hypothetical protein
MEALELAEHAQDFITNVRNEMKDFLLFFFHPLNLEAIGIQYMKKDEVQVLS